MESVGNKGKTCKCAIARSRQGSFVDACKCEFDADPTMKTKKCCRKQRPQGCDKPKVTSEKQIDACPEDEPSQQQQAPSVYEPPKGCGEDPYTALANCVQQCMVEKGQLVEACGMKYPECSPAEHEVETGSYKKETKKEAKAKSKSKKVLK